MKQKGLLLPALLGVIASMLISIRFFEFLINSSYSVLDIIFAGIGCIIITWYDAFCIFFTTFKLFKKFTTWIKKNIKK